MNICFFTTRTDFSKQVIIDYYERILPKEIKLFLFCVKDIEDNLHPKRFKTFTTSNSKLKVPIELRKFCKDKKIDILINISGTAEVSFTLLAATVFTRIKAIFYFLGSPRITLKNSFFLFSQFFFKRILTGSIEVYRDTTRFLNKKKIFYLPLPVNVNRFKPRNKKQVREKLKIDQNEKVIIFVGRIHPAKGSDYLLQIIKQNHDKKFILLGNLLDENYNEEELKNCNVTIKKVTNEETIDYYNAADLCLFLTKRDGFSYVPRESLACETPVILSDLVAFSPIKTKAAIKTPLDIEEIQKKIENFFALPKKEREAIGRAGRKFIISSSSEEVMKVPTINSLLNFPLLQDG